MTQQFVTQTKGEMELLWHFGLLCLSWQNCSAGNTLEPSKWCGWYLEAVCSMLWLALRMTCKSSKMWWFKNAPSLRMWDVEW